MISKLNIRLLLYSAIILMTYPVYSQRKMESLDRGIVAIKIPTGNYISWRLMGDELNETAFNIYRDNIMINAAPIVGATNYTDISGLITSKYTVKAIIKGVEQEADDTASVWANQYLDIPVRQINGGFSTYEINDASTGDLDGDGEYEIVVKRLALNMDTAGTDYHYLEAYKLDGTFLWAINLGPNMYDKVEVNFLVYDLDGDGKAEVATRTSEGTIDALGNAIGDINGDGRTNYRYSISYYGYRTEGPDFISVFNGATGEEITRANYIARDPISQWGLPGHNLTQLSHRAEKCMWTVAYLDGKHPSFVIGRGIYHRTKLEAWDFNGTALSKKWIFDSDLSGPTAYTGQGNHNLSLADVDGDGKDEVVYASMVVDDNGNGLYSTSLGHGDALHVSDMDPDRPGLEIWQAHENSTGATFRDAKTGEILIRYLDTRDCGRAVAGDITAEHKGYEMWAALDCPLYSCNGETIGTNSVPMNYMIWWDGDLLREFCDHTWLGEVLGTGIGYIKKYNADASLTTLLNATGTYTNNYTKGTPCLQADILGDWREEIIWRSTDNSFMRLYTTKDYTTHRIPTLMHDPQYRIAVGWQNNSYNQPPHVGFYMGAEMQDVVPYPISNNKLIWNSGANWDINTSANWKDDKENTSVYNNGDDVLFDLTGNNSSIINIETSIAPGSITTTSNTNYILSGTGNLTGNMNLLKAGTGKLTLNNTLNDYSGKTSVFYGDLAVNSSLPNSAVDICMFGTLYANATFGKKVLVKTDASFETGANKNEAGNAVFADSLIFQNNTDIYFDLSDDTSGLISMNDHVTVSGNLTFEGNTKFTIRLLGDSLGIGHYELIKFTGTFSGNIGNFEVIGIEGTPYSLINTDSSIVIEIQKPRETTLIKWKGGSNNNIWDLTLTKNFSLSNNAVYFLEKDSVLFDNSGSPNLSVTLSGDLYPANVYFNSSLNYSLNGAGSIAGTTGLTKSGTGKLAINNTNTYTGATVFNNGNAEITQPGNAGVPGPIGAADNSSQNIVFNGGTLTLTDLTASTNRNINIQGSGGTVYIGSAKKLDYTGIISGTGTFIKAGGGTLTLSKTNTHTGGVTLKGGEIYLSNALAINGGIGTGTLTIESGILSMPGDTGLIDVAPWNINVPKNASGELRMDPWCTFTGSLTGEGTLNLYTPWKKSYLNGDWSAFAGVLNVLTDANGGLLLLGNKNGYPGSSINLGNKIKAYYNSSSSDTIEIGELTGTPGCELGSGDEGSSMVTWKIGAKGSNSGFDGIITDNRISGTVGKTAIIKTGEGILTLTNSNTYSGGTLIEGGTLMIENVSGSGTGNGNISVTSSGTIAGNGYIYGQVTLDSTAMISPGNGSLGTIHILNSVKMKSGSYFLVDINSGTYNSDTLYVSGTITLNGTLYLINYGTAEFHAADSFKIINAVKCNGSFSAVTPKKPAKGLIWDFSTINSDGYLRVKTENTDPGTSTSQILNEGQLVIYPNPSDGKFTIYLNEPVDNINLYVHAINGELVYNNYITVPDKAITIDLSNLKKGIYFITLQNSDKTYVEKIFIF